MNRNLLLVGSIFGLLSVGCSSGLEWKGTVKGTFEIQDSKAKIAHNHNDPPLVPLETGSGSATLYTGLNDHCRLGKDTPIPDCTFTLKPVQATGTTSVEYKLFNPEKAHTGETNDGKGCVGRVDKGGPLVPIEIIYAAVTLNSDGEVYLSVDYQAKDGEYKRRDMSMKGKRGWF